MNPPSGRLREPVKNKWSFALPALGAAMVLAAALWAFMPLEHPAVASPPDGAQQDPPRSPAPPMQVALDRSAFSTPLWVAPTPPPAPPPAAPVPTPPPPIRLQLLAVIKDQANGADRYKAMVYDPDTDKVRVISAGEKVGASVIESVDQTGLRLKDAHGTRVLTLKAEGGRK